MAIQNPRTSIKISDERDSEAMSLVVFSLEPWEEVRGRIRILVDEIVDIESLLQVLYVCPATNIPRRLSHGKLADTGASRLEKVHPRIHLLRPRRWLPRWIGPLADRCLERQVLDAVGELGLRQPLLWVNDAAYAQFTVRTGWPTLYDITGDGLLAPLAPRMRSRLRTNDDILLEHSGAVVVCSAALAKSRGRTRTVELIPNAVDVELFRTPRPRPADLPPAPAAVYVGSIHADTIDIPLVLDLARSLPDLHIVLIGPVCLPNESVSELENVPTIHLLGPRPYHQIPAFLQYADLVVIPYLVSPYTESLDPIKVYECLATGRPTVVTPVDGFRQIGPPIVIADRERFAEVVSATLEQTVPAGVPLVFDDTPLPSWRQRAESMASLMDRVRCQQAVQ
jgi:glycosyltransferase involved in cell wall biosynthesis